MTRLSLTPLLFVVAAAVALPAHAGAPSPATFKRLYADHAEASSFLRSNWNKYEENYHPSYVLDDNPKTAWVEGVDGDGAGQWIEIPVSPLKSARAVRVVVMNGYQKSKNLLEANAAPKTLVVSVLSPNGDESGTATMALKREMGAQTIDVPLARGGVRAVRLTVQDVHTGKVYKDLCISDVQIFVDSDVPYAEAAEKAKQQALLAWVKDRVAAAAYYAKLPKTYPYASAKFVDTTERLAHTKLLDAEPSEKNDYRWQIKPRFKTVRALLDAKDPVLAPVGAADQAQLRTLIARMAGEAAPRSTWSTAESKGAVREPDGLSLGRAARFLQLGDVTFSEAADKNKGNTKKLRYDDGSGGGYDYGKETVSNYLVTRDEAGKVQSVYFSVERVEQERGTWTQRQHILLSYDEQQRLVAVHVITKDDSDMGEGDTGEAFSATALTYDAQGRVSRATAVRSELQYRDADLGGGNPEYAVVRQTFDAQGNT